MEQDIATQPQTASKVYRSTLKLSVRRKQSLSGLPGDDPSKHNLKIGSSIKNRAPLSGLSHDEEKIYLPAIVGVAPDNHNWGNIVNEYWNNISERVPSDEESVTQDLPGREITFVIEFKNSSDKSKFDSALSFEEKGEISKRGICVDGVSDFVLFRYCLVYGRVANSVDDIGKSPKIRFYLYSKSVESRKAHNVMQSKLQAQNKFAEIMTDESIVDSLLRMFKQHPEDYNEIESKHMALYNFVESNPADFLAYSNDQGIKIKGAILEAVELGIIYNPANTESYYFGENKEMYLGGSLDDVVIWWKTKKGETAEEVKNTIKSLIKEKRSR